MKMGTGVETLVDLHDINGIDTPVFIPKGTIGVICDEAGLDKGYAMVEIWGDGIPENAWGVYFYKLDELKIIEDEDRR